MTDRALRDTTGQIRKTTLVGLCTNIVLAAAKLIGGAVGHSHAVMADGVHSLSDMATDLIILVGVRFWTAPPDENHPHGHHRIETVVTTMIGLILVGVAVGMVADAISNLRSPASTPPGWLAFGAAASAIVIKEALYRYTIRVGRAVNSAAVIANAWHQRSDMLSSIPAALAVLGTKLLPGWTFLDSVGAIVVSIFIVRAAYHIVHPALSQLVDTDAGPEIREEIERLGMAIPGVRHVHAVRTRHMGSRLTIDMHVEVDGDMTVREGHALSTRVKHHLIENGPNVSDVVVHLEPDGDHLDSRAPESAP